MAQEDVPTHRAPRDGTAGFPLSPEHWQQIISAMGLSEQLARVAELVLRDFSNKQIATALDLGEGTVKDYLKRIALRTGTRGRVQLAMRVLAVSHQVLNGGSEVPTCPS